MSVPSENALIEAQDQPVYHPVHILRLPQIFSVDGALLPRPAAVCGPEIWPDEFLSARARLPTPFREGVALSAFVAFNFTTKTPALYNIATGHGGAARLKNANVIFLRSTPRRLLQELVPVVVCDRLPLRREAKFSAGLAALPNLDWPLFRSGSFQNTSSDPTKSLRIAAELLCYGSVPLQALDAILCWDDEAVRHVSQEIELGTDLRVIADPKSFFSRGT